MRIKHYSIICLAFVAMLTSCLSEPKILMEQGEGIPINLDGSINQISTKVNAQGFEDGDGLGLYAVNYENANQTPGTLMDKGNQVDHVKYFFDETNWKWAPIRPVYYKDVNTNVDLYAFYPHAEPSSVSAYNFEVQKDQSTARTNSKLAGYEASDFLWGKTENVVPTESAIKVKLSHIMAGALVILQEGTGFEEAGDFDLVDKKVLVTNTTRKASINIANGSVTPVGAAQATGIVMSPQSDGTFRAIVVPQTVEAGLPLFSITIGGQVYNFSKDVVYEYVAGKLSQFTITVNRKFPSGEYELVLSDTQIIDWKEDINTHEGEARQYYCVHCAEPGTLGRLIKADKKNPNKIKNLKVAGRISDEDFYFMRDSMAILESVNLKESKVVEVLMEKFAVSLHDGLSKTIRETKMMDDVIPASAFYNKRTLFNFTFPEKITDIGNSAFDGSKVSGSLVLPDDVKIVGHNAFSGTYITSVIFSNALTHIGNYAFSNCTALSNSLTFSEFLSYIGKEAFADCGNLKGKLILPNSLEYIGEHAFSSCGNFTGDLRIPDKISVLGRQTFSNNGFTGNLYLNNVIEIGDYCFHNCGFQGDLIVPEGVVEITSCSFCQNNFTTVSLPSSLKLIKDQGFSLNKRLSSVIFKEGLVAIDDKAFWRCPIEVIDLPSTLQTIGEEAFTSSSIYAFISRSIEPPMLQSSSLSGVSKDNFTLEVPENAVSRYKADVNWGEFKRIEAHHDFSIGRSLARSLNAETEKTYILRAPSGLDWSIESKPDWITVSPTSGTGKTKVTITFSEMTEAEVSTIEFEDGTTVKGRAADVVFLLDDKDYRTTLTVEQYDYEYGDGDAITLNKATVGKGVNLVFLADCYDAKDIANGTYLNDIEEAYGYFFDVEPYKSYKEYFNVYAVFGVSDDSGIATQNTIRDAKFGSQYSLEGIEPNFETCYEYATKADVDINPTQTLIVMVENTTEYGGICYMWGDGTAIACCPKSDDAYPYDFRGIVQHEAGGHGFGKLADEYIYHSDFINSCNCDCCEHLDEFLAGKDRGWYSNLETTGDINQVGWSHLIFHPQYSNVVDVYEGGYFHARGVYRSEPTSCMNNNIPYFSAISRQAIVERIMEYAGEKFVLDNFYANDSDEFGTTTKSATFVPTIPNYNNGKQFAPKYMGAKPDFLNN